MIKNKWRLYKLTFKSGKSYFGISTDPLRRYSNHKQEMLNGSKNAVHCAWRKYGKPVLRVLSKYKTITAAFDAEKKAIKSNKAMRPGGYNMTEGGENPPSMLGRKRPAHAIKMRGKNNPFYGKRHRKASRRLMSKNAAMHRPEVVAKMVVARKWWKPNAKHRATLALSMKGKKHKKSTRVKMSNARKNWWIRYHAQAA